MKYIIPIYILILLTGCKTVPKQEIITVEVPVIRPNIIQQLEPFDSQCDKLTEEDRLNYQKVAQSCKNDLEVLKKRDEIHRKLIEENNKTITTIEIK